MFSLTIMHVKVLVFTAAGNNSCMALGTTNMINNACVSIYIGLEVRICGRLVVFNMNMDLNICC